MSKFAEKTLTDLRLTLDTQYQTNKKLKKELKQLQKKNTELAAHNMLIRLKESLNEELKKKLEKAEKQNTKFKEGSLINWHRDKKYSEVKKELKQMKKRNNDLAAHIINMAQDVLDEAYGK